MYKVQILEKLTGYGHNRGRHNQPLKQISHYESKTKKQFDFKYSMPHNIRN